MQGRRYLTVLNCTISDRFVGHHPAFLLTITVVSLRGSEEVLAGTKKTTELVGFACYVLKLALPVTINRSTQIEHVEGRERAGKFKNAC